MERVIMARKVALKDADRSFDIAFWQAQEAAARFRATWELVEHSERRKGNTDELRLQRTVTVFQRQRG
jgi:hypothetical protein